MSINDFIMAVLNITSDMILNVFAELKNGVFRIYIKLKEGNKKCPTCNDDSKVRINCYKDRTIKHSVFNNRDCVIVYRQRRYFCPRCESTFAESNPFGIKGENLSYLTKVNILEDLRFEGNTYSMVAKRNGVSTTTVQSLFDKCVDIKRLPLPKCLSIDEHHFPSSDYKGSTFICILMDFETGKIIDVLPDRKKKELVNYFYKIRKETLKEDGKHSELDNVVYVSIDMYDTYKDVAETMFKGVTISADSFHVIENLLNYFTQIKNICKKSCQDPSIKYLFNKFKFIFNHNLYLDNEPKYNKVFKRYLNLRDIQTLIFNEFSYLKTAYELKELYLDFNGSATLADAEEKLNEVIKTFKESGVVEYEPFVITLTNWKKEIVNSFTLINGKRLNNSYIESMNKKIERLLYNANGYINNKRARNRFLYCLNSDSKYQIK